MLIILCVVDWVLSYFARLKAEPWENRKHLRPQALQPADLDLQQTIRLRTLWSLPRRRNWGGEGSYFDMPTRKLDLDHHHGNVQVCKVIMIINDSYLMIYVGWIQSFWTKEFAPLLETRFKIVQDWDRIVVCQGLTLWWVDTILICDQQAMDY